MTWLGWLLAVVAVGGCAAAVVRARLQGSNAGLQVDQLRRLHRAELAVATAPTTYAAAKELAGHALALLGAPVAVVLIEGAGDHSETVRVVRGNGEATSVYEPGSRMRLLDDDGTPMGSIAVAPRADGRPYDARDEQVLDALAQRVSSTLHRLSLFEDVRAERRALADVLDSSSDAICAVGSDLRVQSWNPAMERSTGVAAADAVGKPCCSVFRPLAEDGSPRFGGFCPCRSPEPTTEVLRIAGPDDVRWFDCSFSPREGGGTVVVARDVTARKRLDDEKADFLATVSHELRTPLTPLKGFLQTLVRRGSELRDDERHHVYEVLLREEERLERLVDQLLRATSLDRSRPLDLVAFDARELAAARVEAFQRAAPDRDITVDGDEPVGVLADPDATARVLDDLLSNAVKYTPAGSPIVVRLEPGTVDGAPAVLRVQDRGSGVAEGDRERVFDKFTRLGDHLTRPQQGVGLGLYIVRRTVEGQGGTVRCEAAPGGGASFVIELPAADVEPAAIAPNWV